MVSSLKQVSILFFLLTAYLPNTMSYGVVLQSRLTESPFPIFLLLFFPEHSRHPSIPLFAEENEADGVFLDLPNPWVALKHAYKVLAPGGVLCSFSPCIEQVQRTCYTMSKMGFEEIRTFESLLRPYNVVDVKHNVPSVQLNSRHNAPAASGAAATPGTKRPLDSEVSPNTAAETATVPALQKKALVDYPADITAQLTEMAGRPFEPVPSCIPVSAIRGHTGYLSFGVLYRKTAKFEAAGEAAAREGGAAEGLSSDEE